MGGERGLAHIAGSLADVMETVHHKLVAIAKDDPAYCAELWDRGWMWLTAAVEAGGPFEAAIARLPEPQRAMVAYQHALSKYRDSVIAVAQTPVAKLTAHTEARKAAQIARAEFNNALNRLLIAHTEATLVAHAAQVQAESRTSIAKAMVDALVPEEKP